MYIYIYIYTNIYIDFSKVVLLKNLLNKLRIELTDKTCPQKQSNLRRLSQCLR